MGEYRPYFSPALGESIKQSLSREDGDGMYQCPECNLKIQTGKKCPDCFEFCPACGSEMMEL